MLRSDLPCPQRCTIRSILSRDEMAASGSCRAETHVWLFFVSSHLTLSRRMDNCYASYTTCERRTWHDYFSPLILKHNLRNTTYQPKPNHITRSHSPCRTPPKTSLTPLLATRLTSATQVRIALHLRFKFHRPNIDTDTSEASKENSKKALQELGGEDAFYGKTGEGMADGNPGNVAGGLKA